jgi:hypothetical protein
MGYRLWAPTGYGLPAMGYRLWVVLQPRRRRGWPRLNRNQRARNRNWCARVRCLAVWLSGCLAVWLSGPLMGKVYWQIAIPLP